MRERLEVVEVIGESEGTVLTPENRSSISNRFFEELERLDVDERNDGRMIEAAEDRTVFWYNRLHHSYGGRDLNAGQVQEILDFLAEKEPGMVARINAGSLVDDLATVENDLPSSGLPERDEAKLREIVRGLRNDLLDEDRYRAGHDMAMKQAIDLIKRARGTWAEVHLIRLEKYLHANRWWLR
jgi:hypothetical protein